MRSYAEKTLAQYNHFISINAEAENTLLPNESVDLITVAQAFHWFDRQKFSLECQRILKASGYIALIWNSRLMNTPFLQSYDTLLKTYSTDYNQVNHQNITADHLATFFTSGYQKALFPNQQIFDLNGVYGRLDSSSYAPKQGQPAFEILRKEIKHIFNSFAIDNKIPFKYETEVYIGKI